MCEKWSVIFVISKFFLPTNVLKRSAIADDRTLFATLLLLSLYPNNTLKTLHYHLMIHTFSVFKPFLVPIISNTDTHEIQEVERKEREFRDVFKTQSNIYDGAFSQK